MPMSVGRAFVGHFEIPAGDPERTARFYREVFEWRVERRDWEGGPYFAIRTDGPAPGGADGAAARGAGMRGGLTTPEVLGSDRPLLVVHVEGAPLEAWLVRIEAAGGRRDGKVRELSGMGRFARFRDPAGNLLGLWEAVPSRG